MPLYKLEQGHGLRPGEPGKAAAGVFPFDRVQERRGHKHRSLRLKSYQEYPLAHGIGLVTFLTEPVRGARLITREL
jgi:hypothetical protein